MKTVKMFRIFFISLILAVSIAGAVSVAFPLAADPCYNINLHYPWCNFIVRNDCCVPANPNPPESCNRLVYCW